MGNSQHEQGSTPGDRRDSDRLDSWKEIAVYLDRGVRTVYRWEKDEDLPVHRHLHNKRETVYAYRSEIDTWRANRSRVLENDRSGWFRSFSENKKTVIGAAGGVALFLLVVLVAWMASDFSSKPEILNFQKRDWVLIADFDNRTGESVFDGVLESALRREIANSQFVSVVLRERIEDTLQLMRKPPNTRIDANVAREISMRDGGIKALLTGRVEKLDSTYLLSIELIDPTTGQGIAATSEEAAGQSEVLNTLRLLSSWSRETLGEKLSDIQASEEQLERVTTPSLRALQLFTKAEAFISQRRNDLAEGLLKQALVIDPEFASAHIYLAHAIRNQRKPAEEYLPYAEKAVQLAERTHDRERYFIQGSYYGMKGEPEKAAHAYETLLSLYPDHFWATNNLASLYRVPGQERKYLTYMLRRAELRPSNFLFNSSAARAVVLLEGDLDVARFYVNRALNLITSEDIERQFGGAGWVMLFAAYEAFLQGDPQTALLEADRMLQTLRRLGVSGWTSSQLGGLYLALGKFQVAQELSKGNSRNSLFLAGVAYLKGEDGAMKKHLREYLESGGGDRVLRGGGNPMFGPLSPILLVRAGLLSEAEKILHLLGDRLSGKRAKEIQIPLGALALSRGNITEGMAMIENTLPLVDRPGTAGTYFLGCEILAKAWRLQGDLDKAVQLLEEASEKKSLLRAQAGLPVPLWMGLRLQLAQLYREMDRSAEARKIEDELRNLLAYADPDHPILRQLDHTKEIALLEAAN